MKLRFCLLLCATLLFAGALPAHAASSGTSSGTSSGSGPGVRKSILAGTWYPADPDTLGMLVEKYLADAAPPAIQGEIMGLITPHAGYVYSGRVAAQAFKLLRGRKYDTVVVIAPSHRAGFQGVSVYGVGGYQTPLGVMGLDMPLVLSLMEADSRIRYLPEAHDREHAVEIELPFLQTVLPGAKLVPLVMGSQDPAACRDLAKALVKAVNDNPKRKVLLVASSDLSHYHPRVMARALDGVLAGHVGDYDPEGLERSLDAGKCEACGGGPMVTVMLASKSLGANESAILGYADSGDSTGDTKNVVGYLAAAFFKGEGKKASARAATPGEYTEEERALLRACAREAVESRVENRAFVSPGEPTDHMKEVRGVFVTLKKNGRLRGCIGNLVGTMPLYRTVESMAASAAFSDPRFNPVGEKEYKQLEYEISVLTPLRRIDDPSEVEVGRHGILMRNGGRSGTLLPQVPGEWGWDREEFLRGTCRKSGLPDQCWKDENTEIYVYSAEVF